MLVHIALTKGKTQELAARVGDCVHRAVTSALDPGDEGCFQILSAQVQDSHAASLPIETGQPNATAVVLLYPTGQISDRKKRLLFGRIGEGLEHDGLIARKQLVVGIIEQPYRNWCYGGAAMKLQQMMASGLV